MRYSVIFTEITFCLESSILLNTNNTGLSNDIYNDGQVGTKVK